MINVRFRRHFHNFNTIPTHKLQHLRRYEMKNKTEYTGIVSYWRLSLTFFVFIYFVFFVLDFDSINLSRFSQNSPLQRPIVQHVKRRNNENWTWKVQQWTECKECVRMKCKTIFEFEVKHCILWQNSWLNGICSAHK